MVIPTNFLRRSFVQHRLVSSGARFVEIGGAAAAIDFGEPEREAEVACRSGLADLSVLPRAGFKGAGSIDWLRSQGVRISEPNRAMRQPDGELAAHLGGTDILILSDLEAASTMVASLTHEWPRASQRPRGYPVPRADGTAWLLVTGANASDALAKVCAVDLRTHRFSDLQIAQTHVAQVGCIIIRADIGIVPSYHLLLDSASAVYCWDCLLDTIQEFGGIPIGINAIHRMTIRS